MSTMLKSRFVHALIKRSKHHGENSAERTLKIAARSTKVLECCSIGHPPVSKLQQ